MVAGPKPTKFSVISLKNLNMYCIVVWMVMFMLLLVFFF